MAPVSWKYWIVSADRSGVECAGGGHQLAAAIHGPTVPIELPARCTSSARDVEIRSGP